MHRFLVLAVSCGLALLTLPSAVAQEKSPPSAAPASKSALPDLSRAQVTVPADQLLLLLGRTADERVRPPVDHVFLQAASTVIVQADRAAINSSAEVNVLAPHWVQVPVAPAVLDAVSVKVDGQPCPVTVARDTLLALLSGPGRHKLEAVAEAKVAETPQGRQVEVPLPPVALVTLSVTLPGAGLDIQSVGAVAPQITEKANTTVFSATYRGISERGAATARILWKPRPALTRPTRLYADTQTLALVDDGLVRVVARAETQIVQTPTRELRLRMDAKAVVLSVIGKNIARWEQRPLADAKAGETLIAVTLAEPTLGNQPLEMTYEIDFPAEGAQVAIAPPRLEGARRDQGWIGVATTGVMAIQPGEATAPRVGVSQLPEAMRRADGKIQLGYHYTQAPAAVRLTLARTKTQQPKRFATTNTLVSVQPGRLVCQAIIQYEILQAGVDRLRIALPQEVELIDVKGDVVRSHSVLAEDKGRVLVIDPKDLIVGGCELTVTYARRFKETDRSLAVPLLTHPDAEIDRGSVGVEVRANYEITPAAEGFERVDVKELPDGLWSAAGSPILLGFRYAAPPPAMTLALTRHEDLAVLVAMSDFGEASTVVTPDGKCVTKMMFVMRNNRKPFLTLTLPDGAEMWSALVDDRPVTPARNAKGDVLIPLKKSEEVEDDDEDSYRARRDRRRKQGADEALVLRQQVQRLERLRDEPKDLKPYDVEIVFVGKKVDIEDRGQIAALLPKCDIPTGHLAWAVFLPKNLRVMETIGTLQEVSEFTLPFRHFGVVEHLKRLAAAQKQAKAMDLARAAQDMEKAEQMAVAAKAQGVLPVRIEIPITGEIYKFEKFLVVDEAPEMTLVYRRKSE